MNTITLKSRKTKTPRTFKIIEVLPVGENLKTLCGVTAQYCVKTPRGLDKLLQVYGDKGARLIGFGSKSEDFSIIK